MQSGTRRRPTYCFLFILLFADFAALSQQAMLTNQQRFTVDEGLPQNFISGIAQDSDGFIWLSTMDGLCRYDGRGFRVFRHLSTDTTSIFSNTIYNILSLGNNKLSLFYDGMPVEDFDMRTFKVTQNNIRHKIASIPGALWRLASVTNTSTDWLFIKKNYQGVGWYNMTTGRFEFANKANGLLQQDTITAMVQSPQGRLYLVSPDGVQVSDAWKKKFRFIRFTTGVKKLPQNADQFYRNYSIVYLPGEKLAIYEDERSIILLDLLKITVTRYFIPPPIKQATQTVLPVLKVDAKGRTYFGNMGRIFRLDENGQMKLLWENHFLPQLTISSYFIDRSDVLWVSVSAQGVTKVDLTALPFQTFSYHDNSNFASDIVEQAGTSRRSLPAYWINSSASYHFRQGSDNKGNRYVCYSDNNHNEVFQLNEKGLQLFKHLPPLTAYSALVVMPGNAVWVYDSKKASWYCWKNPDAVPEIKPMDAAFMQDKEIADAKFIGGYLWVSTYAQGLLQLRGATIIKQYGGIAPVKNLPRDLTEICPDPVDTTKFWVGSRGGGMVLWDVNKGLQKVFTTTDGLPNNTVYCILADRRGRIWGSTNKGIFCFDPLSKKVVLTFERNDGLQGNEFNRAHKFLFADGRIAFGGMDGYTIFNPADFTPAKKIAEVPVQLTSVQINNEQQEASLENSIVKEPLSVLRQIDLPYYKNNLRFEFSALLFNQPQKTKYRYQLQGADNSWIENGTNNIASYAALRPGNYVFRINATDAKGQWSASVRELRIIVHPPFWATWWAYAIYIMAALACLRWYLIYREKSIRVKQSLAFETREALRLKELDEVKDRFFSNVTHEFRTPLTLIITPLEKLAHDPSLSPSAVQTVRGIERNSRQLLRLINEFLDFSKLNDGKMQVKLSSGEFDLFVTGCIQSFEAAAREKNIQFSFACEGIKGLFWFDEEKCEKVIANLLSNALKFTPPNGSVSVLVTAVEDEKIRLEVKDSGPGIPADQQQKIFERFYQADDSSLRQHGGTGIGLSLVKELVNLMHGQIEVDSLPGKYSRFIVQLPIKKATQQKQVPTITGFETKLSVAEKTEPLIMIVEDNNELRQFLAESLRVGYNVISAADGVQAWNKILEELPDIVISDIMMPGRDGFDLCHLCKQDRRTAHIGFVLLTSKAAHESRMKGLQSGADDYIVKPFHLDELDLRIANLLQLQQKNREHLQAQLLSIESGKESAITDPFLLQLYREIDAKLDDPQLGIDYLCNTMAMSRSTLNRKLKSLLGTSPNDLVRQYRLKMAASHLSAGEDIASVAYKVGFSSHSYFTQCFREQYGITPSDYIARQQ